MTNGDILGIVVPFHFTVGCEVTLAWFVQLPQRAHGSQVVCLSHHSHVSEPFRFLLCPCYQGSVTGRTVQAMCFPSFCRIHLEDLSQSVLLHMTEKLGYKNSDVINTVLSNRASHTLAIYFLLNKKLERYLASLRVSSA